MLNEKIGGLLNVPFKKWFTVSLTLFTTVGFMNVALANYDDCCQDPCCCETANFTLYADFIYWQVRPDATEFVRQGGISGSVSQETSEEGKVFSVGCDFEPGFRIGAIFDLNCCEWDAFAQYTFLIERMTHSVNVDFGVTGVAPIIFNLGGLTDVNFAKGDWHSDFNAVDFGFGRTFEVNCCYAFRPHFGLKATWQEFKFDVTYERIVSTTTTNMDRILLHSEFDGIGLRGGFDAAWKFSSSFSFVGGFAVSTLYSDWHTERVDWRFIVVDDVGGIGVKNVDLKQHSCILIPVVELQAGVQFETETCDCYRIFAMLGYENQVWWGVNRFILFGNSTNNNNITHSSGNLTFQGLVLRAGVAY
ncbi:MAG: hypothetical protein K940chlam3_00306 [Chlamydiae bacterium]|nr:hypothetical protein [Chlamydiota bacterium]